MNHSTLQYLGPRHHRIMICSRRSIKARKLLKHTARQVRNLSSLLRPPCRKERSRTVTLCNMNQIRTINSMSRKRSLSKRRVCLPRVRLCFKQCVVLANSVRLPHLSSLQGEQKTLIARLSCLVADSSYTTCSSKWRCCRVRSRGCRAAKIATMLNHTSNWAKPPISI